MDLIKDSPWKSYKVLQRISSNSPSSSSTCSCSTSGGGGGSSSCGSAEGGGGTGSSGAAGGITFEGWEYLRGAGGASRFSNAAR